MSLNSSLDSLSSHSIVSSTIQDLFEVQNDALENIRMKVEKQKTNHVLKTLYDEKLNALERESLELSKMRVLLEKEKDKLKFALSETEILKERTKNEREKFEATIKNLQNKASRETKRCDFLHEKCRNCEKKIEEQSDLIGLRDDEIRKLKVKLKSQKDNHKMTMAEIDINRMQESYISQILSDSYKKNR